MFSSRLSSDDVPCGDKLCLSILYVTTRHDTYKDGATH